MRRQDFTATAIAAVAAFSVSYASAEEFTAKLSGFNEIGSIPTAFPAIASTPSPSSSTGYTGAVLSDGTGTVKLDLDQKSATIAYTLSYSNVGTTPPKTGTVLFAHIHFGKSRDSGGVLVFFCTNAPFTGTGPTPQACPQNSGTVSGTWTAADVQAIPGQNVVAGDFDALTDALTSNTAYANVHTTSGTTPENAFPGGEIRGQVHQADRDEKHDNHEHR
jgi:CHRD domain